VARFDSASRLALRLIKKNGRPVVLSRTGDAPVPNPDKPWRPGRAMPTYETAYAVFFDFGDVSESYSRDLEVIVGDKLAYIAGADLVKPPELRDRVVYDDDADGQPDDDAESWGIEAIKTLEPNGRQLLYQLQLRR